MAPETSVSAGLEELPEMDALRLFSPKAPPVRVDSAARESLAITPAPSSLGF